MNCKLLNANCKLISQHDQRGRLARTGAVARRHSEERVVHAAPDSPRVSGENGGVIFRDVEVVEAYIGASRAMRERQSLLNGGLKGTYVNVEPFHLFRYLDEQVFRFNNRTDTDAGRFAGVLASVTGRRVTYKMLIGGQTA